MSEKINEPRYPSFKGIMAAKKKPVTRSPSPTSGWTRARSGWRTRCQVTRRRPKPPKSAGQKITDEGDGGDKIAAFLVGQKLI